MSADQRTTADRDGQHEAAEGDAHADPAELATRLELVREENRRLRESYQRARKSEYRRSALGMAAIGALAAAGGLLFPDSSTVLFALAGTGLFGAVLTHYLTPERFIAASVGEDVYDALDDAGARLEAELGLTDERVYVPVDGATPARLYVPQHRAFALPDASALDALFVVTDDEESRGVALTPTGAGLFEEFERTLAGPLAEDPAALADQLADGAVEAFELARSVRGETTGDGLAFAVSGAAYGPLDRFDHPVASFLAVATAVAYDAPVALDVARADGDRAEFVVTCTPSGDTEPRTPIL